MKLKTILITLFVAALAVSAFAQTEPAPTPTFGFAGVLYNETVTGFYGVLVPVATKANLYVATTSSFSGKQTAVHPELVYGRVFSKGFFTGVLLGTGTDWVNPYNDPVTYVTATSGVMVAYTFSGSKLSMFGVCKYLFSTDTNDLFKDGVTTGGGLALQL